MTQFHHCLRLFALLTSGIVACTSVQAAIISDNLSQTTSGYQVLDDSAPFGNLAFAQAFSTTANSTITSVTVNLSMTATNSFLAIYNDSSNKPGSLVATIDTGINALTSPVDNNVFSGLSIPLSVSTKYWLVLGGSTGYWGYNNVNTGIGDPFLPNNTFQTVDDPTWHSTVNTAPYRLKIEAVPEPSAWLLAGGAAAALGLLTLRARGRVVRAS